MLGELVHPNQNMEMGSKVPPTMATTSRSSGTKAMYTLLAYGRMEVDVLGLTSVVEFGNEAQTEVQREESVSYHCSEEETQECEAVFS